MLFIFVRVEVRASVRVEIGVRVEVGVGVTVKDWFRARIRKQKLFYVPLFFYNAER